MRRRIWCPKLLTDQTEMKASLIAALTLSAFLSGAPAWGQEPAGAATSRAESLADSAGRTAGAASYCQLDSEMVEHYINLAQGKLSAMAEDAVDRAVLKFRFNNELTIGKSREPEIGCEQFAQVFPEHLRNLQ